MDWSDFYRLVDERLSNTKNKAIILWFIEHEKVSNYNNLLYKIGLFDILLRFGFFTSRRTPAAKEVRKECPFKQKEVFEAFMYVKTHAGLFT